MDWLSELVRSVQICEKTNAKAPVEVCHAFSGPLKKYAAAWHLSETEALMHVLFKGLKDAPNEPLPTTPLATEQSTTLQLVVNDDPNDVDAAEVKEEKQETEAGNMLRGIDDDCLGYALTFLDFRDRCLSIERTSRFFFLLSRKVPLLQPHIEMNASLIGAWSNFFPPRRLKVTSFDLTQEVTRGGWGMDYTYYVPFIADLLFLFSPHLKTVIVSSRTVVLSQVASDIEFPLLTEVHVWDIRGLADVLANYASVASIELTNDFDWTSAVPLPICVQKQAVVDNLVIHSFPPDGKHPLIEALATQRLKRLTIAQCYFFEDDSECKRRLVAFLQCFKGLTLESLRIEGSLDNLPVCLSHLCVRRLEYRTCLVPETEDTVNQLVAEIKVVEFSENLNSLQINISEL